MPISKLINKAYLALVLCFTFVVFIPTTLNAKEVFNEKTAIKAWLTKAEKAFNGDNSKIRTKVSNIKNDKVTKERDYLVYTRENQLSLVIFVSPQEKNQKVLMVKNDFWLFLPNSRKSVHITARQKLLGDAAAGDIARLSWSTDYDGNIESCSADECILNLHKKHTGPTYDGIKLWLRKSDAFPLKAIFYFKSGRIAKKATYYPDPKNTKSINKIKLTNELKKNAHTIINFSKRQTHKAPLKWFNPAYLVRHKNL